MGIMTNADSPLIEFNDPVLTEQTTGILANLREYRQPEYFEEPLRRSLVDSLKLESTGWQELVNAIWGCVHRHGYVVVRNLPFDANNRLSVGLATLLGRPIAHNSKVPDLVREIRPRDGERPLENFPHTDSPHWIRPNDMITLECKLEDQHIPVYSRIVPVWKLEAAVKQRDEALWHRLYTQKYPFILIPDDGDGGFQMQPVLTSVTEGGKEVTHVRFCLTDARTCVEQYELDERQLDDLAIVEDIAQQIGEKNQFPFYRGDWLVFDNKRTLHSKTETSPRTIRTLKKLKLEIDRERIYR